MTKPFETTHIDGSLYASPSLNNPDEMKILQIDDGEAKTTIYLDYHARRKLAQYIAEFDQENVRL